MSSTPVRKVLICDDNPFLRSLLADAVMESWPNVEIQFAGNGRDGEQLIRQHDFHVIFMDVEMPYQNGIDTIRRIRKEGLAKTVPLVLCTGCTGDTELCRDLPEVTYRITKPFEADEIDRILDEIKWSGYSLT